MSSDSQSVPPELLLLFQWPEGAEVQTYKATCHCRKFTYEFRHPSFDVKKPVSCNCTFCTRTGGIIIYGPEEMLRFDDSSATRDELSKIKGSLPAQWHHFCPGCGNYLFWSAMGYHGVNVRMFEGIEVEKLNVVPFDGRNRV